MRYREVGGSEANSLSRGCPYRQSVILLNFSRISCTRQSSGDEACGGYRLVPWNTYVDSVDVLTQGTAVGEQEWLSHEIPDAKKTQY